ncbi:acyltransferase [Agromyces sp. Leaf222]|uniref:acyltransferase n=1 Tax=Agromyces sp. Leaf222 TaxID=1735688 RepID=UPI0007008287|nr:acyltransferase [Agromyces sp. Leaf222]KQM84578.1 acetyltransferase [Agromyces sp. Leaf222]
MAKVSSLERYSDEAGNVIEYEGPAVPVNIVFTGRDNTVRIASDARIGTLSIQFDCDNGVASIASSKGVPAFSARIRVGQDSRVLIGENVSTTEPVGISATEGTTVEVGRDTMIAIGVQLRADDGHPIFDVRTERRVNLSRSISIGPHVWLATNATVLGGVTVGSGAVIGFGSIVTKDVPNNCVAVGNPARVVRRDTAWERPHLSLVRPFYKPDASTVPRTAYWALTEGPAPRPRNVWIRRLRHPRRTLAAAWAALTR